MIGYNFWSFDSLFFNHHARQLQQMSPSIQEWTKQYLWKTGFKKFEGIWSAYADHIPSNFLKVVFHKYYLIHYWILCPKCKSSETEMKISLVFEKSFHLDQNYSIQRHLFVLGEKTSLKTTSNIPELTPR